MHNRQTSTLVSLGIHIAVVTLLFTLTINPGTRIPSQRSFDRAIPLIAPYQPKIGLDKQGGGGGGGDRSLFHASQGSLPKAALRQFVPPAAVVNNAAPKLIMEPTIVVSPNSVLPTLNMAQLGDPNALAGPASNGTGSGGGIGDGKGGGVGPGDGLGYGPGKRYGVGDGPGGSGGASTRGQVIPAALLWKVEPEYSEEARRARLQGTVVLLLEVDPDGKPRHIQVHQSLGLGLDEKAIDAVMRWKFRPGRAAGKPVATSALVEVNFRLL